MSPQPAIPLRVILGVVKSSFMRVVRATVGGTYSLVLTAQNHYLHASGVRSNRVPYNPPPTTP